MKKIIKKDTVTVASAKAVILGDSGVGKSGLFYRLNDEEFISTSSTHGASIGYIRKQYGELNLNDTSELICEIELWDLAGQPDYNVVHQIFLNDVSLAIIVIDEERMKSDSIGYWIEFLQKHSPKVHSKILVSARVDRGFFSIDKSIAHKESNIYGFSQFVRTSAKTGEGIQELYDRMFKNIKWEELPWTISPYLFHEVRQFIKNKRKAADALISVDFLRQKFKNELSDAEINSILQYMNSKGEIIIFNPRQDATVILSQPEILYHYGSSIVLSARSNAHGQGEVDEADVLRAKFDLTGFKRLPALEERIILDSVVSMLIETKACYQRNGKLIFPSLVPKDRGLKCFLSHNSADKPVVKAIATWLLNKGIDVWLDIWEILAGESLTTKIEEGIEEADAFIIVMSPNSMKAKWVREELRIAIQKRVQRSDFSLIPILLEDCDIPGFLKDYVYVDWRNPTEDSFDLLLNSIRREKMKPMQ